MTSELLTPIVNQEEESPESTPEEAPVTEEASPEGDVVSPEA